MATKLADKVFYCFKHPKQPAITENSPELTEKEMDALQYLAGYVIKKFINKAQHGKNYNSSTNQATVRILKNSLVNELDDQKLVKTLSRGGLTAVSLEFQRMFLKTEIAFRIETSKDTHLDSINIQKIAENLMEDTEVISHYNSIVDSSGVPNVTDELRESLLSNMLRLYLRVRAFSLA